MGFPHSSVGKELACNAGDLGSIPGQEDPLVKEMATHSSILAWRILWTEEPGGLQSSGSQKLDTATDSPAPTQIQFFFFNIWNISDKLNKRLQSLAYS